MRTPVKFGFIDPDGNVHHGENIRKFAREHDLNPANMQKIHSGDMENYRGWTIDQAFYDALPID